MFLNVRVSLFLALMGGVILEGELKKKRANKVLSWRKKYYVLSRTYGALFFWTGGKNKVEGIIKKVRFETFLGIKHLADKADGKRFELRVITGRSMQLLSNTAEDAKKWVNTIKSVLGASMAVLRIQAVWRGHCARKALKKVRAARSKAVASVAGAGAGKSLGTHAVHGVLKAKDDSLVGKGFSLLSHAFDKADPKAKAKAGAGGKPGAAGAKRFGQDEHAIDGIVKLKLESAWRQARRRRLLPSPVAPPAPPPLRPARRA
jgi:hypothetical protein